MHEAFTVDRVQVCHPEDVEVTDSFGSVFRVPVGASCSDFLFDAYPVAAGRWGKDPDGGKFSGQFFKSSGKFRDFCHVGVKDLLLFLRVHCKESFFNFQGVFFNVVIFRGFFKS